MYDWPVSTHLCHISHYFISTCYILQQLEAKVIESIFEKKLDRQKVLGTLKNIIYNLWENRSILNDTDLKHTVKVTYNLFTCRLLNVSYTRHFRWNHG